MIHLYIEKSLPGVFLEAGFKGGGDVKAGGRGVPVSWSESHSRGADGTERRGLAHKSNLPVLTTLPLPSHKPLYSMLKIQPPKSSPLGHIQRVSG